MSWTSVLNRRVSAGSMPSDASSNKVPCRGVFDWWNATACWDCVDGISTSWKLLKCQCSILNCRDLSLDSELLGTSNCLGAASEKTDKSWQLRRVATCQLWQIYRPSLQIAQSSKASVCLEHGDHASVRQWLHCRFAAMFCFQEAMQEQRRSTMGMVSSSFCLNAICEFDRNPMVFFC